MQFRAFLYESGLYLEEHSQIMEIIIWFLKIKLKIHTSNSSDTSLLYQIKKNKNIFAYIFNSHSSLPI